MILLPTETTIERQKLSKQNIAYWTIDIVGRKKLNSHPLQQISANFSELIYRKSNCHTSQTCF